MLEDERCSIVIFSGKECARVQKFASSLPTRPVSARNFRPIDFAFPIGLIGSENFRHLGIAIRRRCRLLCGERRRSQEKRNDRRPDHSGPSAIMAVKLTSQVTLPSTLASPANLQTRARFWTNSALRSSSTPGVTGLRNLAFSIAMK